MNAMRRWVVTLVLAGLLAGCAGATGPGRAGPVMLDVGPRDLDRPLSYGRIVTGTHNGQTWAMRVEVEATTERLAVVGLSTLGATLFVIEQDGAEAARVSMLMPGWQGPDPRYMLFDLYVSQWPVAALGKALSARGMDMEVQSSGSRRIITTNQGVPVATVTYAPGAEKTWGEEGEVRIEHFDPPFEVRVAPLVPGRSQ